MDLNMASMKARMLDLWNHSSCNLNIYTWILSVEADEPVDFGRGDRDKAGTDTSAVDVVHLGLERLPVGVLREPPERHVPDVPGLWEAHPPRDRRVHAVAADHNLRVANSP